MNPKKTKDIKAVLLRKGFREDKKGTHHSYYYFYANDERTQIKTFFSHGKVEYDKSLLNAMKHQLKFDTNDNFEDFINCPMSEEDYLEMLISNNNYSKRNLK